MIHEQLAVGPLQCNCHILADESTGEAVIVDPGDDAKEVLARVKGYRVKYLLHTHCHLDHITGTRAVKEGTGATILIHRADKELYDRLVQQYATTLRLFGLDLGAGRDPLPVDRFLEDGEAIPFGRHSLSVIHTPGHTQGSCCFHVEGKLFSGDTLFRRSIGRTDLTGGNQEQELASIRAKLYTLDPDTSVFPGHGGATHIAEEKRSNPFVRS